MAQAKPLTLLKILLPYSFVCGACIALPGHLGAVAMVALGLCAGGNALLTTVLRQFTPIGGKVFAVLRIASACGNMFGGSLVGFLLPWLGRLALPAVCAGSTLVNIILLMLLLKIAT